MNNEHQRLDTECRRDELNGPSLEVVVTASDASTSLERVKEVMRVIASDADGGTWSSDREWLQRLPNWFTQSFRGRTTEEVLKDDTLWDFGSWLDAMRQRGWQWWSSTRSKDRWSAVLVRQEDVYSIEPLIYLARQSGASSVEVKEYLD